MYITCDLLGPLLTVVWTTNINSRLPQTRTPHVSPPRLSLEQSLNHAIKYESWGRRGEKPQKSLGILQPLSASLVSE